MNKPRIVLADDDDSFRALLADVLMEAGYEVLKAVNGVQAVQLCENHSVAAAIVDLVMPEKEGMETIFELRKRFPGIKTIAISGGGRGKVENYLQMARKIGADATLAKPFGTAEILETLRQVLETEAGGIHLS